MQKINSIAIVGLGTLGSQIAKQLASLNYNLTLIDFDTIEQRNIPIQTLYTKEDLGKSKVLIAQKKLKQINPKLKIKSYNERLTEKNISLLATADLVIECTDNLTTRFLINDFCHKKIPLIHTAAFKSLASFYIVTKNKPCLHCIYQSNLDLNDCRQSNINPATAEKLSSLVLSQIKNIEKNKQEKRFLRINMENNSIDKIKITRRCEKCQKSS
ncbi:MAG TPA: ThiF family adenylyltransferase [Candidatus Nanoarchaeia archaeon]|nr:ThiF family adenylyltransferase [Candidatus Nanoarchaeia archaeon]